jgi:hypothetical protein
LVGPLPGPINTAFIGILAKLAEWAKLVAEPRYVSGGEHSNLLKGLERQEVEDEASWSLPGGPESGQVLRQGFATVAVRSWRSSWLAFN